MNSLLKYREKIFLGLFILLAVCFDTQSQTCQGSLGDPVVNVNFGTGTNFVGLPESAPAATTTYLFSGMECPVDGSYSVGPFVNSNCVSGTWHSVLADHTPNDVNGRMAIFNASLTAGEFYNQTISGLCGNTTYEFGAWVANILRPMSCAGQGIKPNLLLKIESLDGNLLGSYTTGPINESALLTWKQYAFLFTTSANTTQVVLKISNIAPGGCGNDLVMDDITFRPCGPAILASANVPICQGSPVLLTGSISSGYNQPQLQWQQSTDTGNTWTDVVNATSLIANVPSPTAGTLFRLLAAEQGNIGLGYCRIASNPVLITIFAPEIPVITPTSQTICAADSVQSLRAFVNIGITADWYDAPTNGNKVATGVLSFKPPKQNATYYIETRDLITDCKSVVRAKSSVTVNDSPSFISVLTAGTCYGDSVRSDASIRILEVKRGKKYDITQGKTYSGGQNFGTATPIPSDGTILQNLANPDSVVFYAVRVFDSTGCFTDSLIRFQKRDCQCPNNVPVVIPQSQIVCEGDTFRTVRGYVDPGLTVDWYDAQGNLLKAGSIFFKPVSPGTYFAEARLEATNCRSLMRVPSSAGIAPKPTFFLEALKPTCEGNNARNNVKLRVRNLKSGNRFDVSVGSIYNGNKDFDTATPVRSDSILARDLPNPVGSQTYTVRIFGSAGGCFTDQTITINRFECDCLPFNTAIIANSFALCTNEPIPTLLAIITDTSLTIDWFDAATNGQLLAENTPTYTPTQLGTYYAEARVKATGCASSNRAISRISRLQVPDFEVSFRPVSCLGDSTLKNGELRIKALNNGDRYDLWVGSEYKGNATYQNAKEVAIDGLLVNNLPNPTTATQPYTVRGFNRCESFRDRTITFTKSICKCNPPNCIVLQVKRKVKK